MNRRQFQISAFALALMVGLSPAQAAGKLKVIASFSVLGDMVKNVAGNDIDLKVLVGPNGDTHEYQPTPNDAKAIAKADLVLVNGFGLEGWMTRLIKSSGYKGKIVEATQGIEPLKWQEEGAAPDAKDPHAWQNAANGKVYVANVRDALVAADPAHADDYRKNAEAYIAKIEETDAWVKAEIAKVPEAQRKVISTHDAFQYFAKAYNVEFLAPQGISTEAQPSAAGVAKLVDQIRAQKITAVFFENMTDSRLIKQLEKDAGAHVGGTLYSDAISAPEEPAPNYLAMFMHNVPALVEAMNKNPAP
jgi:zinc/manganese transport system substrate-binding protein